MRGVIAISAIAFPLAVGGAHAAGDSATRSVVIRLIAINSIVRETDKPPKGPSAGDWAVTKARLRNKVAQFGKPAGAFVGNDRGRYTFVSESVVKVDGVATLPGGTLIVRGRLRIVSSNSASVPVVGGTGRFAHARGSVYATDLDRTRALNVYRLTLP
jgi:hypothetical protein